MPVIAVAAITTTSIRVILGLHVCERLYVPYFMLTTTLCNLGSYYFILQLRKLRHIGLE